MRPRDSLVLERCVETARRSTVTEAQYRRILEVKAARAAIPSDKALARELGMSTANIRSIMHRGLKSYERKS